MGVSLLCKLWQQYTKSSPSHTAQSVKQELKTKTEEPKMATQNCLELVFIFTLYSMNKQAKE